MRAGRWLIAVITTRCERQRASAGHPPKAFVQHAHPLSLASNPSKSCRARYASAPLPRRRSTASMSAESGQAAGESWCGHELLNTVTTDWVDDHLGDPEVWRCSVFDRFLRFSPPRDCQVFIVLSFGVFGAYAVCMYPCVDMYQGCTFCAHFLPTFSMLPLSLVSRHRLDRPCVVWFGVHT